MLVTVTVKPDKGVTVTVKPHSEVAELYLKGRSKLTTGAFVLDMSCCCYLARSEEIEFTNDIREVFPLNL